MAGCNQPSGSLTVFRGALGSRAGASRATQSVRICRAGALSASAHAGGEVRMIDRGNSGETRFVLERSPTSVLAALDGRGEGLCLRLESEPGAAVVGLQR